MSVFMRDCISPDVPRLKERYPDGAVAGYVTGQGVEWSETQFALFTRKIRILQQPSMPQDAAIARGIDVERGAATFTDVPVFLHDRHAAGHDDGTVYASASNWGNVVGAMNGNVLAIPRYWVAWWWNQPGHPTAIQVIAEVKRLTGIEIPVDRLWACQFRSDQFWDTSVVYGTPDFSRT